ncbi:hypothetical protein APY04_0808 [Hyphomicrobium sulfonivorans]|uniref:HTH cro/C1-type domain-containing protein n=1 Tax=Hyphomicrobium sulfonivorans TaxID=121290 RepID=A0A109BKZ5_HYPSL|nr:helix-turn-helix domain-containing protein [Hyphomicrobium sulfonivorans]KWT70747.1 hypothetical protein APY04_0808 [Hyphomicrobium sulfonivorans]
MTPAEVRAARKALGLTQTELGEILAVSQVAVSLWERDGRAVPGAVLLALRYMLRYGLPVIALK